MSRGHENIPLTAQSSFQGRGGEGPLPLRAHLETDLLLLSLKKPWASWENTLCVPVPRTQDNWDAGGTGLATQKVRTSWSWLTLAPGQPDSVWQTDSGHLEGAACVSGGCLGLTIWLGPAVAGLQAFHLGLQGASSSSPVTDEKGEAQPDKGPQLKPPCLFRAESGRTEASNPRGEAD